MINIIGQIFGSSGYSSHTRQLANALSKIEDVRLTTQLFPGWELQVNDEELKMIKERQSINEINLIITHPNFWRINCDAKRNWVYLVWEGDKVPDYVIEECLNESIEYIIVPSKHTYNALMKTAFELNNGIDAPEINAKVKLIYHGVDLKLFYPKEKKDKTFRFFANKGLRNLEDRGGVQYLIKAYLEEFKHEEDVELMLKINPAYGTPNLLTMFPELKGKTPKITLNQDNLPFEKLVDLYNDCDVFVSPTRAEAFNLPCLEALACGKPVITTNFGGQFEYVTDFNGWIIGGELTEIKHELQYEGISWITPDMEQLKKQLRSCFNSRIDKKETCIETAKHLTWDRCAESIKQLI